MMQVNNLLERISLWKAESRSYSEELSRAFSPTCKDSSEPDESIPRPHVVFLKIRLILGCSRAQASVCQVFPSLSILTEVLNAYIFVLSPEKYV